MSSDKLRNQIQVIQGRMKNPYYSNYEKNSKITAFYQSDANLLQQIYGEYLGNARAKHKEYSKEFSEFDYDIRTCFVKLAQTEYYVSSFGIINLAIGKICELVSFVETIESMPPEDTVPITHYNKLLREKEEAEKTARFLVQHTGLPELRTLMENTNKVGIAIDEYWVLALCSSNLIEAVVNRKLEQLGEKAGGSFRARYQKLCRIIKQKENRELQKLLPIALYEGVRNKLDHASDSNRVTPQEAKDIGKMVIAFMNDVFQ